MGYFVKLFWLFLSLIDVINSGNHHCCKRKCLGDDIYNFITTSTEATKLNCKSECVYEKLDEPSSRYCFKDGGDEIPKCEHIRVRRNLNKLNETEQDHLKQALKEAKISGTYKGKSEYPITGVDDTNPSNFDAAYDAATSFHGYPGLCAGPGAEGATGGCCIHGYSTFLPWHRLFMIQLEDSLRSNPNYSHITLPYWDWTQDFHHLPSLVADSKHPSGMDNPFYHSRIPGIGSFTKRSPQVLVDYTNNQSVPGTGGIVPDKTWPGDLSVLMDLTLTALEETEYESFEKQIEYPHNMVHNMLGFVPQPGKTLEQCIKCYDNNTCNMNEYCYPYTMQNTYWASYDPIFLPFHSMVDFQWAVYQALQKHRNIPIENDCFPGFNGNLQPFNREDINSNKITRAYPRGKDVLDYRKSLAYEYENLTLNGMTIPELDDFLKKRNDEDRLFAGFSLPNIHISLIEFEICLDVTCHLIPHPVMQVHKTRSDHPGIYQNPTLLYVEVTRFLPSLSFTPDQNLRFQIVSSSIPKHITYNPVSIYRKAGTNKDKITIHWPDSTSTSQNAYAPFFKVSQNRDSSIRFLLKNGTQGVFKYKDREAFDSCSEDGRTLVTEEIDVDENTEHYFQNPDRECNEDNKIIVDRINTCTWGDFHKDKHGNGKIGWQLDMSKYIHGICMEKGTFLALTWRRGYHAVLERTKAEYDDCSVATSIEPQGHSAEHTVIFPDSPDGFSETTYIICPIGGGSHCHQGMKLKIHVKENC